MPHVIVHASMMEAVDAFAIHQWFLDTLKNAAAKLGPSRRLMVAA